MEPIENPNEQVITGAASLTGYQAFTKKEDLLVYEKFIFTIKEEGYPSILSHFDPKLAANSDEWSVKYPHDSMCTIDFDAGTFTGELSEIAVSRKVCEAGGTNTYKFAITRQMNSESMATLVVPYLNAREEQMVEKPKTKWSKGGVEEKLVKMTFAFRLTI